MADTLASLFTLMLEGLLILVEVPVLGLTLVGLIVVQVLFDGAVAWVASCGLGLLAVFAVKYWSSRKTAYRVIVLCFSQALLAVGYGRYFSDSEHSTLVWVGTAAWVTLSIAIGWLAPSKQARARKTAVAHE